MFPGRTKLQGHCDTFSTAPRAPVPATIVFFAYHCFAPRVQHLDIKVILQVTTLWIAKLPSVRPDLFSLLIICCSRIIGHSIRRRCRNQPIVTPRFAWAKQQIVPHVFGVNSVRSACTLSALTWTTLSSNRYEILWAYAGCAPIAAIQMHERRRPIATP